MRKPERELRDYFEYTDMGVDVLHDGLQEMTFGEFLVERGVLTRAQLFAALMEQERQPGIPLGEVVAFLGYLPYPQVDRLLTEWAKLPTIVC